MGKSKTNTPWLIYFFKRNKNDDPNESVPAKEFLDSCPTNVAAKLIAVLKAVSEAPPPVFSGGGKWEAMHGKMKGFYEIRVDGKGRHHYRLFCILEREGKKFGLGGPSIVLINGKHKEFRTKMPEKDYEEVRKLGVEYSNRLVRSVED